MSRPRDARASLELLERGCDTAQLLGPGVSLELLLGPGASLELLLGPGVSLELLLGLYPERHPLEREEDVHLPALVQARVEAVAPHRRRPLVRVPRHQHVQRVRLQRRRRRLGHDSGGD